MVPAAIRASFTWFEYGVLPVGHGPPTAGVVVAWQHTPVHHANAADWIALVITTPFDDALLMSWVGAERLIELQSAFTQWFP